MNKHTKLNALKTAMIRSKRDNGEEFYHFDDGDEKTHEEIKELKDLFLEHMNVADIDYEIFSRACDVMTEVYEDAHPSQEKAEEDIYDRASDSASVYTHDRLAYLSPLNEDEISQTMREYGEHSIATSCAIWYDKQVEQAAIILNNWVHTR